MMGRQSPQQYKFFLTGFTLEKRIRAEHILRKISAKIDFDFIYAEVKETYGANGNVSIPPPIILKMLLLLVLYNVRSERELMETIPERMDWMWFLGLDLDDEIPDHSVLSKARARWGIEAFRRFFQRVVRQCVEEGLVDGSKLFVDASLIQADASNNSVVDREKLQRQLDRGYERLEERLDEVKQAKTAPANVRFLSATDPDASVIRHGAGKPKLRYKTHRGVDPKREVITATMVTPGATDESAVLEKVVATHEQNTERKVETVVADSRYGTIENYLMCHDAGIQAHIPSLEKSQRGTGRREDIFPKDAFRYDRKGDIFICPAGRRLRRRHFYRDRNHFEYLASSGVCSHCRLKPKCTRSKIGRTLKRHARQEELDWQLKRSRSPVAQKDLQTRQHLSERSFARSVRYGYKRARWRRCWRMQIQDFLIAAIQNIMVLIRHSVSTLKNKKWRRVRPEFSSFLITKVSSGLAHLFLLTSMAMFTDYFGQQAAYP